ncbi:hypothetical protein EXM65_12905 [Clostridium botulinum]|uniref:Uncharacterized protein n=1 Tax=Clostridium botulinum TaxID=1491 RepID=A0A6M0SRQ0_CLOBO|nr:hypothetical protein [Clostridium botulinum]
MFKQLSLFSDIPKIGQKIYTVYADKAMQGIVTKIDYKYIYFKLKNGITGHGSINNLGISIFKSKEEANLEGYL